MDVLQELVNEVCFKKKIFHSYQGVRVEDS